eukprot:CAMPEP_0172304316 /NCGR_PEP_ID=MMETSP1058-20130122/5740_1 /TAXON_ID=83371 /ORGANISM="Detonula confervacea, Strain CCMP 353" /LENGTH=144 /DNA_ID=CAMNT_0013015493 /DNA_START=321 /DNA_END=755 /DNA_ORIENTATION=-
MLGFSEEEKFTIRELRHAYFEAAKRHHPDVVQQHQQTDNANSDGALDFRNITEAYEHLLSGDHNIQYSKEEMQNIVSISEEEEYRLACKEILGLPAEIVEESKKKSHVSSLAHWKYGCCTSLESIFCRAWGAGAEVASSGGIFG